MTRVQPWKELYLYWESRRTAGRPPRRSALDVPVDIPHLTPNIMLIETVGDRLRYRLVGSAAWARYHMELTGTWIEERNQAEAEWRGTIALVRDDAVPRLVSSPVPGENGKSHIAVALPLLDDEDRVHQILAGTFYAQDFGETLKIGRLEVREILEIQP